MCLLPKCAFLIILAAHYTEQKLYFPDKLEIRDAYRCFERFPKMVVFDLDYTLWPFGVDHQVKPPFTPNPRCLIVLGYFDETKVNTYLTRILLDGFIDANGKHILLYSDTKDILKYLKIFNVTIAAASLSSKPKVVNELLDLFDINKYFAYKEIYWAIKSVHFEKLHQATGIDYKDMLYFDDEFKGIWEVKSLGVHCTFVKDGIDIALFNKAMHRYDHNITTMKNSNESDL